MNSIVHNVASSFYSVKYMTSWCSGILITIQLPLSIFTVGYRLMDNYNNSVGKVCATTVLDARPHRVTSRVLGYNLLFFVACKAPSAADGAGNKGDGGMMEVISEWDHRTKVSGTHRQLRFRPSRDPSPPASRLLRQGGPAVPHACAPRNPDNAGTNYHNRPCNEWPTRTSRASGSPSINTDRIRPPACIR